MPSVFGYWTLRGLGQASRFVLEYTGEEYEDVRFDALNNKEKWQEEKAKNPHGLEFPNLPFYVDGDVKLTQSSAILHHLAKRHGLAGSGSDADWRRLDLLEGVLGDVRMTFAWLCYGAKDEESFNKQRPMMKERIMPMLKQLSAALGAQQWLLGDKISFVDFLLYDVLSNWLELEKDLLGELPTLQQLRTRFEALPAIKAFMQSDRFIKWPISGPDAFFGGK